MTNEEAIKELEHMKSRTINFLEIDVFDKAIEALSKKDPTPVESAIYASWMTIKKAIKALEEMEKKYDD